MRSKLIAFFVVVVAATKLLGGAWGVGSFANDDASDWVINELEFRPQAAIKHAIRIVLETEGYLQVTECANAVAACEVLAAAQGRPAVDLPPDVVAIAKKLSPTQSDELRAKAKSAIERILKEGELQGLWRESDHYDAWKKVIEDLKGRI